MKMRYRFVLVFLMICVVQPVFGQDTLRLSHQEFLAAVKSYHPLAFKYRLQNEIARAEIQRARGNFDPVVEGKKGEKTIDGIDYYKETNIGLGIPTWYGIELNGSYNYIDGQKLNNSDTRGGLYQFGLTVPLAKNLVYDRRRALLDQARIGLQMTEAEQLVLTNDLLLAADNAYWNWVKEYEIFLLQSRAVTINQDRLALTRKTYQYGERAAIDTTEALSQLQSFELEQKDAYLQFVKATQELSLFLWKENQQPYDILEGILPSETLMGNVAYQDYAQLLAQLSNQPLANHASVMFYLRKQDFLESERRLKFQSFLPKLDLTYNFFNKENYRSEFFPLFQNNYQYGLKLEIPIFLRQARGDYRIAKNKVQQNLLDIDYKRQEINTKLNTYKNEVLNYRNQIDIATQNIDNYERLVKAEEAKYNAGESSLFLINSRENKLIDAQEKILELRLKFIKGYNQLKWLNENFMQ